jgi:hypothetical protein
MHSSVLLFSVLSLAIAYPILAAPLVLPSEQSLFRRQTTTISADSAVQSVVTDISLDVKAVTIALNALFTAEGFDNILELAQSAKDSATDEDKQRAALFGFTQGTAQAGAGKSANDVLRENFVGQAGSIDFPQQGTFFEKLQIIIDAPGSNITHALAEEIGGARFVILYQEKAYAKDHIQKQVHLTKRR